MIPLPEVIEYLDELPPEFCSATMPAASAQVLAAAGSAVTRAQQQPLDSVVPAADLLTLARFRELMAGYGWPVQIGRMLFDRAYAFDRMALAHSSGDETLSALALELFESSQRAPVWRGAARAH